MTEGDAATRRRLIRPHYAVRYKPINAVEAQRNAPGFAFFNSWEDSITFLNSLREKSDTPFEAINIETGEVIA